MNNSEINNKDIFTKYFLTNFWQGKESISGPGSDLSSTRQLIKELSILLKKLEVKTFLDAPCGDFNWMKHVDLSGIKYSGADIVEELINVNKQKYSSDDIDFFNMDITKDSFKKYDLIMVRDTLIHLTNDQVMSVINNVKKSGSRYFLTSHHAWLDDHMFPENERNNVDIKTGQWRRVNLQEQPFNLKPPVRIIVEGNTNSKDLDKSLALYLVKDLPDF
jgi:SAM-dependent methyltransferase